MGLYSTTVAAALCLPFCMGDQAQTNNANLLLVRALTKDVDAEPTGPTSTHNLDDADHVAAGGPMKHDPALSFKEDGTAKIVVRGTDGSLTTLHPHSVSDPVHYISAMYVMDQDNNYVWYENTFSLETPDTSFTIPENVTSLTPFEFCNLHGLWKGPTYNVEHEMVKAKINSFLDGAERGTNTSSNQEASPPDKHDPFVTFTADGKGTVAVRGNKGSEEDLHPMTPTHYISTMWLEGQHGNIVYMVNSTSQEEPSSVFSVPETATTLTPFEHCNLHGLYQGPTYKKPFYTKPKSSGATSTVPLTFSMLLGAVGLTLF